MSPFGIALWVTWPITIGMCFYVGKRDWKARRTLAIVAILAGSVQLFWLLWVGFAWLFNPANRGAGGF